MTTAVMTSRALDMPEHRVARAVPHVLSRFLSLARSVSYVLALDTPGRTSSLAVLVGGDLNAELERQAAAASADSTEQNSDEKIERSTAMGAQSRS